MTVTPLRPPFTIGGSDAAAACGIDRYRSPVALYGELTGVPAFQRNETEQMRWGIALEGLILDELDERGIEFTRWTGELTDFERPWLVGHPDARDVEAKTHSHWVMNGDAIPNSDLAQMQVYMHLTDADEWTWACLIDGQRLDVRTVRRDQHAIDLLLAGMEDFYGHLVRGEWPSGVVKDDLGKLHPEASGGRIGRYSRDDMEIVRELRARREQQKTVNEQVVELENALKLAHGDAEVMVSPSDYDVSRWSNVTRRAFDVTRFRADHPEYDAEYMGETTTRRFTLL